MPKKNAAFTLIESIIVMVILALGLSGAVYLMITVTNLVKENQRRIEATYLAQECMELTRNARDSAWKQHKPWNCAFDGGFAEGAKWQIHSDPTKVPSNLPSVSTDCQSDLGMVLTKETSNFKLFKETGKPVNYDGSAVDATPTPYERELIISNIKNNPNPPNKPIEAQFTCEVSWEGQGGPQKVSLSQILTDWKK